MIVVELFQEIYEAALASGYDNCGIIAPEDISDSAALLKKRMDDVPSSVGFYEGIKGNYKPVKERYPWAKAIVVLTAEHGKYRYPQELRKRYAKAFFLSPEEGHTEANDHRKFENWMTAHGIRWENGHIPLRYAAMKAGLGIIRKNNFFYTDKGSFVGLTGYIIDRECVLHQNVSPRPCAATCNLCQKACKSGSLCAPYTMDPMRCISFWTTFGKGNVPPFLEESMFEEWICGCDNCQDACPHNRRHNWDEGEPFSDLEAIATKLIPESLLEQSDEFLRTEVIAKTGNHLLPEDTNVLRMNAERAIRNGQNA